MEKLTVKFALQNSKDAHPARQQHQRAAAGAYCHRTLVNNADRVVRDQAFWHFHRSAGQISTIRSDFYTIRSDVSPAAYISSKNEHFQANEARFDSHGCLPRLKASICVYRKWT